MFKQIFLLVLITLSIFSANAQKMNDRTYEKWIKKCDIPYCFKGVPKDRKQSTFWNAIALREKKRLNWQKHQKSKSVENIYYQVKRAIVANNTYYKRVMLDDESMIEKSDFFRKALLGDLTYNSQSIIFTSLAEENAATQPNGQIFVNGGLYLLLSPTEMIAVLAHEYAHYYLCHTYVRAYDIAKKQKHNKVWAGVLTGTVAAMEGVANGVNSYYGGRTYNSNYGKIYDDLANTLDYNTYKHSFEFSQEQELQADIVAARFLQWVGLDPHLIIDALEKLKGDRTDVYSKKSSHPTLSFRIEALKLFLEQNKKFK